MSKEHLRSISAVFGTYAQFEAQHTPPWPIEHAAYKLHKVQEAAQEKENWPATCIMPGESRNFGQRKLWSAVFLLEKEDPSTF